ncbi:MAG: S41 family peptidase [Armatimonadota bacterium]|nr:S41 family peptidase [bacterium]
MKKLRIEIIIPLVFTMFAAFMFGFTAPDVSASGFSLSKWIASLELLPQRLEYAGARTESNSDANALPLIDTYSEVMERLKSDYYGSKVDERELTYSAIRGVLHALGDPFTRFLDPDEYKKMREENEGNFIGIGAQLDTNKKGEIFVKEPLPNTPAITAGVKTNDVITAVDDKIIKGMDIEDVVKLIRGPEGTKVKLTMRRPGRTKPMNVVITRRIVQFQMVKSMMADPKNGIGYIRLYQFNEQSDPQFNDAMTALEKKHIKGLILDLRGNPGGLLQVAVDIGSRFINSGPVVIIQERGGRKNPLYVEEEKHNHKRYPLVVLVDKSSASASEIVSGAIKDTKSGTLVGTVTFGKGRVQTIMPMQDGSAVAITTAKYLTPNGTDIHHKGISPDYFVEQPDPETVIAKLPKAKQDDYDPMDPKYDVQLNEAVKVMKVKMGILPKNTLDKLKTTAKAVKK